MSQLPFNERLLQTVQQTHSHVCVGLDPDPAKLSPVAAESIRTLLEIPAHEDITHGSLAKAVGQLAGPFAAAFKPNAAFFEAAPNGIADLESIPSFLHQHAQGTFTICDAKRGDLANTSQHYAHAIFRKMNYDSITVNPLMGSDSVQPYLDDPARGVFLLCLTSNPAASEFLLANDLYLRIAEKAVSWNRNKNVGLVVGATQAAHAAAIRAVAPELPFLIPGIGAQGGSLPEILDAIQAKSNRRFVINASRSIMFPEQKLGELYTKAVSRSAKTLRDEINSLLG